MYVKIRTPEEIAGAIADISDLLRQRHKIRDGRPDDFSIRNMSQILEARSSSARVMTLLLAAVASISLVVGGIGIMNIMLVSVTERTREIGLRKALGATGKNILFQFLLEKQIRDFNLYPSREIEPDQVKVCASFREKKECC